MSYEDRKRSQKRILGRCTGVRFALVFWLSGIRERLRIAPPTPPGKKGPNTSHHHRDGKGQHYSPAPGEKDPAFQP